MTILPALAAGILIYLITGGALFATIWKPRPRDVELTEQRGIEVIRALATQYIEQREEEDGGNGAIEHWWAIYDAATALSDGGEDR